MTDTYTAWICDTCHLSLAGYSADELGYQPTREPLHLLDGDHASLGLPREEHATDCAVYLTGDWQHECECDHDSFSLWACEGCGEPLAGDRYGVTVRPSGYRAQLDA